MVSQGAKVLVVNEYSMKSSKRSLTSSVYFPLEGVSPFTNPKSKNRIVHGMVTQIHCVGEVPFKRLSTPGFSGKTVSPSCRAFPAGFFRSWNVFCVILF